MDFYAPCKKNLYRPWKEVESARLLFLEACQENAWNKRIKLETRRKRLRAGTLGVLTIVSKEFFYCRFGVVGTRQLELTKTQAHRGQKNAQVSTSLASLPAA